MLSVSSPVASLLRILTGVSLQGILLLAGCSRGPTVPPAVNVLDPPAIPLAMPASWTSFSVPAEAFRIALVDRGREQRPAIEVTGDGERGGVLLNRIAEHQSFIVNGWVMATGDRSTIASIKLDWITRNGKRVTACAGRITPVDKGWQRISLLTPAASRPVDAEFAQMALLVSGKGTARFADLELLPAPKPDRRAARELLVNGSMESVEGPRVAGWQLVQSQKSKVQMAASEEQPKGGHFCVHLKGTGEWAILTSRRFDIEPGKDYTFRGFARRIVGKALLKIDLYADGKVIHSESSPTVPLDEWDELVVTVRSERLKDAQQIAACMVVRGSEMEAWFDDLSLQAGTP